MGRSKVEDRLGVVLLCEGRDPMPPLLPNRVAARNGVDMRAMVILQVVCGVCAVLARVGASEAPLRSDDLLNLRCAAAGDTGRVLPGPERPLSISLAPRQRKRTGDVLSRAGRVHAGTRHPPAPSARSPAFTAVARAVGISLG